MEKFFCQDESFFLLFWLIYLFSKSLCKIQMLIFWKFLKKLTPSQIGSSAATAACAQGRIILRDVLREHRAPRLQSKHECRAE